MSNIAIIDLGTNTFNLLVAEIEHGKKHKILLNTKLPVKLGEGGLSKNHITPAAFERGINAIEQHLLNASRFSPEKIFAFATSAVRSADNGKEFAAALKQRFNIDIEIIDGKREAELIYKGVREAVALNENISLIMDIGGGSTEFILANKNNIFWKYSFNLGAARLLEKFNPGNPILLCEVDAIRNYLKTELAPLFSALKKFPATELIGSSGSFDSLAEMIAHKFYNPDILNDTTHYTFNLDDFYHIHDILLKSTKEERLNMKGLVSMRVDMIVISSIFIHLILQECKLSKMRLSTYSLKEGVLAELIESK
jgi:exopolyphosphatase/guanosine-5'-triphosphate,3'-diphosphate pyrophosphatase